MAGKLIRIGAMALLPLALSACVNLGNKGKLPATLLTLTPTAVAPAGSAASATPAEALMVLEPETDQSLSVLRIPVQVDEANIAYIKGAQWVERPARLFRALLAETLRAKGKRLILEDTQSAVPLPGSRLAGRLIAMGYDAQSQSVVVRYDAVRTGLGGAVQTKRFESVVPKVKAKGRDIGPALNLAANDVAAQVADWVE